MAVTVVSDGERRLLQAPSEKMTI
ncbi:uncharacterized protein G2W53_017959 [Senna tora]|uniref:Uncharacterized protein n=1 Tax=Senna tora TaxID=362788 RepID=A0A834TV14_9FABA|nr:uncharacterized protein G2W53_017959 [Senna tora]